MSHSLWPHGLYSSWNSPGQNTGAGSLSLLQEIFPIQGLNPGLPHCRRILYQLSYQGVPSATKWGTIIAILDGTEERVLFPPGPSFLATPCSIRNFANQGLNPCSLQCKCWLLTTGPSGKSKSAHFSLDYQVRLQPERHYDNLVSVCQAGELGKGTPRQKEQCKQKHESMKQPARVLGGTGPT